VASDNKHREKETAGNDIPVDADDQAASVEAGPTRPRKEPAEGKEGKHGGGADSKKKLTKKDILKMLAEKNHAIDQLTEKSAGYEAEAKEFKDKWLRSVADFENYRKRTRKEWDLLQRQTKVEVILDVLNVVDDFERAFTVVGERDDDVVQGIRLIYNNLVSTLDRLGVSKIDAMDTPFDPAYHMAVAQIDKEDAQSNNVVEIVQEGYLLEDTVIRPAKVVIAK
jgi:molecular chaperone GrpE